MEGTILVTVDDDVEHLKPGMTAIVEIHVQRLEDVISVPVQAVVQEDDATWCYADSNNGLQRRDVKLGISNDSHVEVVEGLATDERVVLNPSAINLPAADEDETQKEHRSPLQICQCAYRAGGGVTPMFSWRYWWRTVCLAINNL